MSKSRPAKKPTPKAPAAPKQKPKDDTGKKGAGKKGGKKGGEVDYSSPQFLAAYDAETAKVSSSQVREVYRLQAEYDETHERAQALKKQWEAARSEHLAYVRERFESRGKKPAHLFAAFEAEETLKHAPKPRRGGKRGAPAAPSENGKAEPGHGAWYPDDIWKLFPLERLSGYGLTSGDLDRLARPKVKGVAGESPPIDTMGALAKFTEPDPVSGFARKLTDISGIGEKAAERIEAAVTTFWSDWSGGLADRYAVELHYRRPDPLEPMAEEPGEGQGPGTEGGTGTKGDGDGAGQPAEEPAAV